MKRLSVILFYLISLLTWASEKHWSFRPVKRVTVPATTNPVDFFVEQKLAEKNLHLSPMADRDVLLRRATLDLIGLPPTMQELHTFRTDKRPIAAAFASVVNRLLASPRYGERWAQHWLDVIRWAETVGFETNIERPVAWHYRDWVIAAFNRDLPYDQFIRDQLAGDMTGADAALGFLVSGPALQPGQIGRDEEAMRSARQDELDEVIRTVSQGMLGLTIGCARCHDHKFDPILQKDYYGMQAIFAGLRYGNRRLRGAENDDWAGKVPSASAKVKQLQNKIETLRKKHKLRVPLLSVQKETFEPVLAQSVRMKIAATINGRPASIYEFEAWTPEKENSALASTGAVPSASSFALANQTRHFENLTDGSVDRRQSFPWVSASTGPAWLRIDFPKPVTLQSITWHNGSSIPADYIIEVLRPDDVWQTVAHTNDRQPRIDDARAPDKVKLSDLNESEIKEMMALIGQLRMAQAELNRLSAGPQTFAASFTKPETTWLLRRGDPMQRLEELSPTIPSILGRLQPKDTTEPERRLALARHLTRQDHPLTARVLVNRVWQKHFGAGLVDTPSDFGKMGNDPTHPSLLDWLASEFMQQGWSIKKLHRLILTSRTYMQSNRPNNKAARVDADSRLLWRYPPRRMEAEAIRDTMLFVSGKLNLKTGGRGFDFFNQRGGLSDYHPKETFETDGWRRMIYSHKVRMQAVDIFGAFDCPDAGQMKPRRTRSITPLQSLSLLNSPFAIRQSDFFAERVKKEAGEGLKAQIEYAFILACSRQPELREYNALYQLAIKHGLDQACRVLFNTSSFLMIP
tara:strand:+ start:2113 stop:4521 length:2409 start_codon:yes stop_codon:yes gene_type:complete